MALGLVVLVLIGIMATVLAVFVTQARIRAAASRPVIPDRVQILSAAWQERDVFQVHVRLSRADGAPLRGWHGIRFVDARSGGFGSFTSRLSDVSDPVGNTQSVDVIAVEKLSRVPKGNLPLQVEGVTALPKPYRSPLERFFFGPDPPRTRALRYSLAGGIVTLPSPKTTVITGGTASASTPDR